MSAEKLMCWLFGIGFWVMVVMLNFAISQRDEAREVKAKLGGADLICKVVNP